MKIRLSARDKDPMENKYDPKEFDAENKNKFQNKTNASNVALELYYKGYKTLASISEQFKLRNYEVDDSTKEIIKGVIEKMESRNEAQ